MCAINGHRRSQNRMRSRGSGNPQFAQVPIRHAFKRFQLDFAERVSSSPSCAWKTRSLQDINQNRPFKMIIERECFLAGEGRWTERSASTGKQHAFQEDFVMQRRDMKPSTNTLLPMTILACVALLHKQERMPVQKEHQGQVERHLATSLLPICFRLHCATFASSARHCQLHS